MSVKSYDPGRVSLILFGQRMSGFADGSMIEVSRTTAARSSVAGADGEVCVVESRDDRATVKVTLLQSSVSNAILSAAEAAKTKAAFLVKDLDGASLCEAPNAWVTKPADFKRGKELAEVEWELEVDHVRITHAGL